VPLSQVSRQTTAAPPPGVRLGVYVDTVYRPDERNPRRAYTNYEQVPFLQFVFEVGREVGELFLFGRRDAGGVATEHELPGPVTLIPLPFYENLGRFLQVARAAPGTVRAMWRGAGQVDVLWVFGPYPFSLVLVACGLLRRRAVILGVRQDTMKYFRSRLPHRFAAPVLGPLWVIDRLYRVLSRRFQTTVVGAHLEREYGGPREGLLPLRISLVRARDIEAAQQEPQSSPHVNLLAVGRVDREKNPGLLVDVLAELRQRNHGRYRLTWIGQGPLLDETRRRADALGLGEALELTGYLPFGPALLERYRKADVFVHGALTEGSPQVLNEAMACGLPIVATAVGGIPQALEGGDLGVLVPPADSKSLADAIELVSSDGDLRRRLVDAGLNLAREHTLEREAARVGALIQEALD
jgi:glycosyltransferase involved in cell wall biosynthesis